MNDPARAGPVRIFVATTRGPVHVQRITPEDPDVSSVVCLAGKAVSLPISPAYDAFVRDPTGVIQRRFGHGAYRVDLSASVDEGYSWQLGLYLAHAAAAGSGLAAADDATAPAFVVSGEVDRDLNVLGIDHLAEKLAELAALPEIAGATLIIPQANATAALAPDGMTLQAVADVDTALAICRLEAPPKTLPDHAIDEPDLFPEIDGEVVAKAAFRIERGWLWLFAGLILLSGLAAAATMTGPVREWAAMYERGRVADLHRALRQSDDPRARMAEVLLNAIRPDPAEIRLAVDGAAGTPAFRAVGPDGVFLSGRGLRWRGDKTKVARPDRVVFLDPRPGALTWRPAAGKQGTEQSVVYRLVVLASRRPIAGPQPWFPALGGLGLPGRAGQRAADIAARLNAAGVTVKAIDHRLPVQ